MNDLDHLTPKQFFDLFLLPGKRAEATIKLSQLGHRAIPILEALFSGQARNNWGVSYSQLEAPLDCALVAIQHLGPIAKPLEPFVSELLKSSHPYAIKALGALGSLAESSIFELCICLTQNGEIALESASTLFKCGAADHPLVKEVIAQNPSISTVFDQARHWVSKG